MTDAIRFLLNDTEIVLTEAGPADTLLDFVRLGRRLTGTKEGCAEGDCGACTVLVGRLYQGALRYEPINACIRFLASCHGCHVVTVEHVRGADGGMHPIQRAMVEHHASQCGFCTPGFVMSLYGLWMTDPDADVAAIETALQGNLCRCTGYEPIVRAALAAGRAGGQLRDTLTRERDDVTARLQDMKARADVGRDTAGGGHERAIVPADVDDFARVLIEHPDATVVAGATDVGLWVTKFLRPISPAIFVGHLMKDIDIGTAEDTGDAGESGDATARRKPVEAGASTATVATVGHADGPADKAGAKDRDASLAHPHPADIRIGAGVTYSEFLPVIASHFPEIEDYILRIGGWQIRNAGTIGGNIANGSPIGEMPPVLIALGARLILRRGDDRRELPIEDFFIDYGKQDRAPGEFLETIVIPGQARAQPGARIAAYKVSKRQHSDISAVAAGIRIVEEDGIITDARVAFGGMAATPRRAPAAEAALRGQPFAQDTFDAAARAVANDFTPLSDWRASAEYRQVIAANLFRRFWLEQAGVDMPVRLVRTLEAAE